MTNVVAEWTGTSDALQDLKNAIARNCACEDGMPMCPAHTMLTDQTVMNRMVFLGLNRKFYNDCENDQSEHTMEGTTHDAN